MKTVGHKTVSAFGKLTLFASEQQRLYESITNHEERKAIGHYGTPMEVASFMAEMFSSMPSGVLRILDPGAGVGILSAALCDRLSHLSPTCSIYIELWETDEKLLPYLQATMLECQAELHSLGHSLTFTIKHQDFILSNSPSNLLHWNDAQSFHWAILNPPYYKLRKESEQATAMRHVVHGQPNIYALFLAVTAELMNHDGQMVAITPRSYFSGPYFRLFRNWFFDRVTLRHIHTFESRTEAFDSKVLQENVIVLCTKGNSPSTIDISATQGKELLNSPLRRTLEYRQVVDKSSGDVIIRVTSNQLDQEILASMDQMPHKFSELGLDISTGPVVTFRTVEHLVLERSLEDETAPLLWMHNIRPFQTLLLQANGKPAHIAINTFTRSLLIPAKRYVLLKRFSSKEEKRRLVAGIFSREDSYSQWLGLENHINYIYKRNGELTKEEAFGVASFLNSAYADRYFRAISGNTQVNAAEVRSLRFPKWDLISEIGHQLLVQGAIVPDPSTVNSVIARVLSLPNAVSVYLKEFV